MEANIRALLNLQEKDVERINAEHQLEQIPKDIELFQKKIDAVKAEEKGARDSLKQLELKRKDADLRLKEAEEKIVKLKTAQMAVKKNEEYQALTKEIELQNARVSACEDEELEILEQIDKKQAEVQERAKGFTDRVKEVEAQINQLKKQEGEVRGRIGRLKDLVEEAAKEVNPVILKKYQQVVRQVKRGPFVVAVKAGRCEGCHLRVSNEVSIAARKEEGIQQCDNCFRILYWVE